MRTRTFRATRLGAIAATTAVIVLGVVGPANAAPTINVTPGGPYQTGASVNVTAEGFTARTNVLVAQCKGSGPVTDPRMCADPATGASVTAMVADGGKVTAALKVVDGEIRPGVSCASNDCVITVISVANPTTENAFVKLGTTTGTGSSAPTTSSAPTPTTSKAVAPVSATPTPTPTPTQAATSTTPTPVATAIVGNGAPAGTPAKVTTALPHTGSDDAIRSLLAGIVVLQLGLIAVVRINRRRRRAA